MRLLFERGTIVIDGSWPGLAVRQLPGVLWDPRVQRHRAPGFRHAEIARALRARGVRFADEVRRGGRTRTEGIEIGLRPYQRAALDAWRLGGGRGTVVLPTGSGKTRVAIAAVARTGRSSLCLVPTRVLLEQWHRELEAMLGIDVGCYGNGERVLRPITVATMASAERHMAEIGDRFDLLVVDEAHHVATGHADACAMAVAPFRLGLTATPPRNPELIERLRAHVGPIVYELRVGDLAGTFLAAFDLVTVHVELTAEEEGRYQAESAAFRIVFIAFRTQNPWASWADFARAAERTADGRRAMCAWRQARKIVAYPVAKRRALAKLLAEHRDSRVLVFTADNDTAYAIAREHLIMPITCDIRRKERDAALEAFRKGELRALVSARVLNEGFDVPDADVAIVVGGAHGEREHVQRIGRVLRPAAGKRALVYELVVRQTSEVGQAFRRRRALAAQVTPQL